jgi:hypothetical protein
MIYFKMRSWLLSGEVKGGCKKKHYNTRSPSADSKVISPKHVVGVTTRTQCLVTC